MLLSPGHSPRHLSTPPPAASPEKTLAAPGAAAAGAEPVGNPRKRRQVVLDEDTYVAAIERIVERDYFPDIPKLRDRLDWLEAVRSGDPVVIRDAQLKILERRSGAARGAPDATATATAGRGSQNQTPASSLYRGWSSVTPFGSDGTPLAASHHPSGGSKDSSFGGDDPAIASLSLDDFFGKYTSEDNESFSKILEKVNRKRKEKYAHLLVRDGEEPSKALEAPRTEQVTDGYGTSGQPVDTLEGWKYTAKNLLMYNPSDGGEAPLTEAERAERLKGLTKEIDLSNTRLRGKSSGESKPSKDEDVKVLYTSVPGTTPAGAAWPFADREAEKLKKYDLEELRKTPNQCYVESSKDPVKGYSFVKTPSPAPGADESPFMTWGEIEGTPLRLDADETLDVGGSSEGPHFSIPMPPSRDVKAHSLSREAARKLRVRSRMFRKPPLPSPARGGSASPSVRTLSPAAQKFVRNAIAKSSRTVDETLRASYRGSSPIIGTPKERKSTTRFARDTSLGSRSPSARQGSSPLW